jgi:hypothetical protein
MMKTQIEKSIESGRLTEEKYKEYMVMQIAKDKRLLAFMEKYQMDRQAAVVRERLQIIQEEIAE